MDEPLIFCIDSSALIDLHKYYPQIRVPGMWNELDTLLLNGRLFSHEIVYDELTTGAKRPSDLSRWITSRRKYFVDMNSIQALYVAEVITQFPNLIDPKYERDQADPWLVASVLERKRQPTLFPQEIVIVSQENALSTCKIPAVCKHYNVTHFDLFEFFDNNKWAIGFQKS
jgi:hypothetical protein